MKRNVQINAPLFPSSSRRVDDSSQGAIILLRLNPVSLRQRDVLRPRVHDKLLRGTVSCVSTSARKTYRSLIARTTAHPARGSHRLMAYSDARTRRFCWPTVSTLISAESQGSFTWFTHGSATSLARISGGFRSRVRSRNTSSGSASGSGGSSRHNSHVSVSSASLALGRARAQWQSHTA
jgi:hypothetical protein